MRAHPIVVARLAVAAFAFLTTSLGQPRPARADWDFASWFKHVRLTGFLQPGFEYVQHSAPAEAEADPGLQKIAAGLDKLGFTQSQARLYGLGNWRAGDVDFDFRLELNALPQPSLYDAYVAVRGPLPLGGRWRVVFGQHKAPFDRQVLVWDPDLQFTSRYWLAASDANHAQGLDVPAHQLGLSLWLAAPYIDWLQLAIGVYNGEGRNQPENVDRNFMTVARLSLRPIGAHAPLVESGLGEDQLAFSADISTNKLSQGDADRSQTLYGADLFACRWGASLYGRFLYGETSFASHVPAVPAASANFKTLGYAGQVGYLLPIPGYLFRRFEVTGRFQALRRAQFPTNTTMPSTVVDPNEAQYGITAGLVYYQRGHGLKALLNYDHSFYPKGGNNRFDVVTDAVFVQVSYKLE